MDLISLICVVVCLLAAIIFHEYAHAWMANKLGDPTAKHFGRLTLNPIVHLDLFGSIVLPFVCVMLGGFIFAYAKPVPVNFLKLNDKKYGMLKVSIAGPFANFILAFIFGIILRFVIFGGFLYSFLSFFVFINLLLGVFNLIPIPPLDGSKIVVDFLPAKWKFKILEFEHYGMILLLLFIFLGGFNFVFKTTSFLFTAITGLNFVL